MAYEPGKWAYGLVGLGVLWLVGAFLETGPIETDLGNRGAAALGLNLLDKPALLVQGRDASLAGAAFTPAAARSAVDAVLGVEGVRLVDVGAVGLIPEAKPYVWSATRDGAKIALAGAVPDPATRAQIHQAAQSIAGAAITDAMDYKSGKSDALAAGAAVALAEFARFSKGSAQFSDGALTISGLAVSSPAYEQAMTALKQLPPGVTLVRADLQAPLARPFVFAAASADGSVKLTGEAPSIASRDAIVAEAVRLFPGARIDNALTIASGAPAGDFEGVAKFALGEMATLDNAKATLTDTSLSISGAARQAGGVEAFDKAMRGLAPGYALANAQILPAPAHPFVFEVAKSADGLRLTGYTPDAATDRALRDAATAMAGGKPVDDETTIASGLPPGVDFAGLAKFALAQLSGLVSGDATLRGADFSIRGVAADGGIADQVQAALAALPAGVTLADAAIERPAPPPPPPAATPTPAPAPVAAAADTAVEAPTTPLDLNACDAGFKDLLNSAHIEFDTAKATISATSQALIKKLAGIALRCQVSQIEISGHTDNQGDDAMNLALSKARAETVVAALISNGVPADRLTAVGYGASKPIASNDTEEGRAQNRRIEFSVKQ